LLVISVDLICLFAPVDAHIRYTESKFVHQSGTFLQEALLAIGCFQAAAVIHEIVVAVQ